MGNLNICIQKSYPDTVLPIKQSETVPVHCHLNTALYVSLLSSRTDVEKHIQE